MDTINLVTLIIAIYGAVLSTILSIWEIKKERRMISILLIRSEWHRSYSITITNIGHRPITLVGLSVETKRELVPNHIIKAGHTDEEPINRNFPITLSDGEHISITLAGIVNKVINEHGIKEIMVFDAEGNTFKNHENISFDSKTGMYEKVKKFY